MNRDRGRFPAYVSTLTDVGERVGRIEQTLTSLSRYYENRERMDRRMQAALLYPAMLILVLLAVAVVLLVWVLPVFNDVYAQLGTGLTGFAGSLLQLQRASNSKAKATHFFSISIPSFFTILSHSKIKNHPLI